MKSTFGLNIRVTMEGESHGEQVRCVAVGIPAGIAVDTEGLMSFMARRRGGQRNTTPRREDDIPEFLSGLVDGVTDGSPLVVSIPNKNVRSGDYEGFANTPRPSHADYTSRLRYPGCDLRGGGHFSARLTAPLCAVGYVCMCALKERGIYIGAHLSRVGSVCDARYDLVSVSKDDLTARAGLPVLDAAVADKMDSEIQAAAALGDSIGGEVECAVIGIPGGIGSPLANGIENRLSSAMYVLGALKGVEFGSGFGAVSMRGSVHNDPFAVREGRVVTETNNSGGIQAGITNGMPIVFRCGFKPTASISMPQRTVSLKDMADTEITISGRHDPCIAVRAVPCVEAVTAIVMLDALLDSAGGDIEACRRGIDNINNQLMELLCARMELAGIIAEEKERLGLATYDPQRETAILDRVNSIVETTDLGKGQAISEIFREIMRITRDYEDARRRD